MLLVISNTGCGAPRFAVFVSNWAGDQKTYMRVNTDGVNDSCLMKTGMKSCITGALIISSGLMRMIIIRHGIMQRDSLEYNEDHVVCFGENVKHPALYIWQEEGRSTLMLQ